MDSLEASRKVSKHKDSSSGLKKTINRIAGSIVLGLAVTACNPTKIESHQPGSSESIQAIYPGTIKINESDTLELKKAKSDFNARISELKEKYGIIAKIYEPEDIPKYAQCNADGNSITKFIDPNDIDRVQGLIVYLDTVLSGLTLYSEDIVSQFKNMYFVEEIYKITKDSSLGYPEIMYPDGFAGGSLMVLKYNGEKRFTQEAFGETFHHELVHIIHGYHWPFKKYTDMDVQNKDKDYGFAREYGKTNGYEDAATIGESIMPLVTAYERSKQKQFQKGMSIVTSGENSSSHQSGSEAHIEKESPISQSTIFDRMRTDTLLAKKIMYMTGSYYDVSQGKFIWDFTPVEFRHFFHVPKGEELPFYARMKKKGVYDYTYWNKVLAFHGSKKE